MEKAGTTWLAFITTPPTWGKLSSLRSSTERCKGTGSGEGFLKKWQGQSLASVVEGPQNDSLPPCSKGYRRTLGTGQHQAETKPTERKQGGTLSAVLKIL